MRFLRLIGDATLRGYSLVLFSQMRLAGLVIFGATLFNLKVAFTGFIGTIGSNLLAYVMGVNKDRIRKGLYGFNGLLVGLSISLYHELSVSLVLMLLAAIVLLLFTTIALENVMSHFFSLPVLSIPFVVVSIVIYLSFYNYDGFKVQKTTVFVYDSYFPQLPDMVVFYFKSLGAIFFQTSPWAGLAIALTMLIFSRIAFFLSILGFAVGVAFHMALEGNQTDLSAGIVGFNYILTCIAVGGIFLVPSGSSFILAALAAIVSALIASFTKIFLVNFNIPVLALPFTTVTLLFLYCARLLHNKHFKVVDFLPGSPERNLDYYKTRLERFGQTGLEVRLPFAGRWLVSQGYSGKFTHKDVWSEALDFMAVDEQGKVRKGLSNELGDFYTYGLPALAPANGKVVRVIDHLEDNAVAEINTSENWGNLVLLQHGPYLFSQLSHLMKGSITVKEGDQVAVGSSVGLVGNSGRSPEPHIHLHFQSTPEVGSSTVAVPFNQYMTLAKENAVTFNRVPEENEIIANVHADYEIKSFLSLAPGKHYRVRLTSPGEEKPVYELWQAKVDFWGNRYLENQKDDRLFFYLGYDYFAALDFQGAKSSALFLFFLAMYRLPFIKESSSWVDRMSYKYFSSPPARLVKDLASPFTDKVALSWKGELMAEAGNALVATVLRGNERLYTLHSQLEGILPGKITMKDKEGKKWLVESLR